MARRRQVEGRDERILRREHFSRDSRGKRQLSNGTVVGTGEELELASQSVNVTRKLYSQNVRLED